MLRRKNYWLLFAILLLSLTSLSPNMELNTSDRPRRMPKPQSQSAHPSYGVEGVVDSLRITVSLRPEEFRELEYISNRYSLSSGMNVELVNIEEEAAEQNLYQELSVGDSPDLAMVDGRNITDLATHGYLLPVDVYQSIPGSAPLTSLIPQMQWNGYDWGVPLDIDPYLLVYSRSRLAELGLPSLPRSLEEWDMLFQNLVKEQGKYLLAIDTRNPYGLSAVLESMGSNLQSGSQEKLEWVQQARGQFYLTSRYNEDVWDMLQGGTIAVAVLPLSEWQKHGNSTLAAEAPVIVNDGEGLEAMYSRFFALPAQSRHPEEAVKWLAYITSKSAQLEWMENTGRLPALNELYLSSLPGSDKLPFDQSILLTDEAALAEASQGGWNKITEAVSMLLTGKLDAAGYEAFFKEGSE